jgi:hypothetical protein
MRLAVRTRSLPPLHRVEVTWPASGQQVTLRHVDRDQRREVFE